MKRYKNGSIIILILSFISFWLGLTLIYFGSFKTEISSHKGNGTISIKMQDYRLLFIPDTIHVFNKIKKVRFRTEPDENKHFFNAVLGTIDRSEIEIISYRSKLDNKYKRQIFNDLDFFIDNSKQKYSKSFYYCNYIGYIGIILLSVGALSFFSMLLQILNTSLVEKDKTKFILLKHDTAFALVLETNKNKDENSILPLSMLKHNEKTTGESIVEALTINEIDKIGIVIDPLHKKLFKKLFNEKVSLIEQKEAYGPVYSIICSQDWIGDMNGDLLIIPDNVPFVTKDVIQKLLYEHRRTGNVCTVLTTSYNENLLHYGMIRRDKINRITGIHNVENITDEKKDDIEVNTSLYCFKYKILSDILKKCGSGKDVHDLILTDIINLMIKDKNKVNAILIKDLKSVYCINSQKEFEEKSKEFENGGKI